MIFLLDILGSTVAGALVLLTLVQFNNTTSDQKNEFQSNHTIQSGVKDFSEVIEFDIYKAGYRVPHQDIFLTAKDTATKFLADLFNDGIIDTISYYLGSTSQSATTDNPDDKPVFRKVNSGAFSAIGLVKDLSITYNDSTKSPLSAITLNTVNGRKLIKSVSFSLIYESQWKSNESYQSAQWKKTIYPKNLH